jgi:hypothetical protein
VLLLTGVLLPPPALMAVLAYTLEERSTHVLALKLAPALLPWTLARCMR